MTESIFLLFSLCCCLVGYLAGAADARARRRD